MRTSPKWLLPQARMWQVSVVAVVAVALAGCLSGTAFAQSGNSEVGTWKLNVAKSKFGPGTALKSATVKVETAGAGVKLTVDQVVDTVPVLFQKQGFIEVRHWEVTANYDGKENPVRGNNPNGDMVACTRINATTTRAVSKKGGKVTVTQTFVVSSDGKTWTDTTTGTNTLGQTVNIVEVYDKQ
jgi:hypothetical protein